MRKCTVFIEKSEYGYSAYIGDTPLEFGCIGEGKTVEETIEDFLGTFEAMKQDYISAGNEFEDVDIEFCYDTASFHTVDDVLRAEIPFDSRFSDDQRTFFHSARSPFPLCGGIDLIFS